MTPSNAKFESVTSPLLASTVVVAGTAPSNELAWTDVRSPCFSEEEDEVEDKDEVVMTSKLVGAEDLREELEAMLAERRALRSRAAA